MTRSLQLALISLCLAAINLSGCRIAVMTTSVQALYDDGSTALAAEDYQSALGKYENQLDQARIVGDQAGIGFALYGIGNAYRGLSYNENALRAYNAASRYFVITNDRFMEALTLLAIGNIEDRISNYDKAIEISNRALNIWGELINKSSQQERRQIFLSRAGTYFLRARAHNQLQQFDAAATNYLRAATDYRSIDDNNMAGLMLWFAAGIFHQHLKQPGKSIDLYSLALPFLDTENANSARLSLAFAYLELGNRENHEKAAQVFADALSVAERQGRLEDALNANFGLARAFEALGEFEKALAYYETFLKQDRSIGGGEHTNPVYFGFLGTKGRIYRHLGRYEEAIQNFSAALLKLREIKDDRGEANVLTMLAEVHSWIADSDTAIRYYKRALELYKKTGDMIDQINVMSALGELWLTSKVSSEEAADYFDTARELMKASKGLDLLTLLEEQSFEAHTKDLMKIAEERFSSFGRWPIMVAGNFYQRWSRVVGAAGDLDNAISLLTLASIYHFALPFDREVGFERAKDWYFLGEAYRQKGDFNMALRSFRLCEELAGALRSPEIHWVYSGLARTYAGLREYDNAILYYEKGLAILESIHGQQGTEGTKIGVFSGALYAYRGLVPLLLHIYEKSGDNRYLNDAFQYTERLKARAFREMFSSSRAARIGGELGKLASRDEKIRIEMQMINDQLQNTRLDSGEGNRLLDRLEELRKSLNNLREEASKNNRAFAQVFAPAPVTLKQVQEVLTSDTAFLEYSIGDEHIILWVITREGIHPTLIGKTEKPILQQFLTTLREPLVGSADALEHVALGKELYRVFLGPVEDQLRGKKQVIIVPDGELYYLPFEALIQASKQPDTENYATFAHVPYLIKEFQISYVPSASVLVTQQTQVRSKIEIPRLPLLAFGDPIYQKSSSSEGGEKSGQLQNLALRGRVFNRLEFSSEEVRRIAGVWDIPVTSEHINLREKASVDRVKGLDLSKYRILHFASHAVLGDKVGLSSQPALILSQKDAEKNSGLLQFSDILTLKLNADLVVLSACDTGLGELRDGEGIVGLTRAFLFAGASSAVVSLWKVEDQSTAMLMRIFHERLKSGETKAAALRQAKLEIMSTTVSLQATGSEQALAAPFFWAPFVLVGDSGSLSSN